MQTTTFEVPLMYGDHHVIEVRRLLLALPGVNDVYASSSFRIAEVQYDPDRLDPDEIRDQLEEAGYLGELILPEETGALATTTDGQKPFFRHTSAFEQTGDVVTFTQRTSYEGRPLWACPGVGVIHAESDE